MALRKTAFGAATLSAARILQLASSFVAVPFLARILTPADFGLVALALSVVKNVKTPTLIMTGEEDYRTPMSESEQYYKALKMRGVESVLVRVPEEPHGIRRRPSHAASKLTTLQGWFDTHRAPTP